MKTWSNLKSCINEQRTIRNIAYLAIKMPFVPLLFYLLVIVFFVINFSLPGLFYILFSIGLFRAELDNTQGTHEHEAKSTDEILRELNLSGLIFCSEMIFRLAVIIWFLVHRSWYGVFFIILALSLFLGDISGITAHFFVNKSRDRRASL